MQVLILCGGKGTRAYPYTEHIPKPMLPIRSQPILLHVMRIYAEQDHREFILSLGYRKEIIIDYFQGRFREWKIHFVDTGEEADTAERIKKCSDYLEETFFATYADGLGNVNLSNLLQFHKSHGGLATLTAVPLPSQYGIIEIGGNEQVSNFKEKPIIRDYWINAGFFVFDKSVFKCWEGKNLEKEILPELGRKKMLFAYRHHGFWKSMDSYKDHQELEIILGQNQDICKVHQGLPVEEVKVFETREEFQG